VIHGAVIPQARLDRSLFHEDLVLLAGIGVPTARITLDWSWLQPKAGAFDGDAVEWYSGLLQHATALGMSF
jgi:beta-galactosidase GanA